jgi:hypothetical protein
MTSILEETLLDILADIGDMKQRLSILERREFRQRHLHSGTARELTIAAGVITVRRGDSYILVDTEADAATDNLDTINGGTEGQVIVFRSYAEARDPTLTDAVGNMQLAGGNFTLNGTVDHIMLICRVGGTAWAELSRSNNG